MIDMLRQRPGLSRVSFDVLVGLALFVALVATFAVGQSQAFPLPPPPELLPAPIAPQDIVIPVLQTLPPAISDAASEGRTATMALLGSVFAGMFAVNMALVRHLRAAYIGAGDHPEA